MITTDPDEEDGSEGEDGEAFRKLLQRVARTPDVSALRRNVKPGTELLGRFTIEYKLGEGGMGRVFAAFDRTRQERVALKLLGVLTPRTIVAIKSEFRIASELVHPNLVRLHELFSDGKDWFFTMDLLEGITSNGLRRRGKGLDPALARHIFGQLALALNELHSSGTLHGDLKPSNFLLVGANHRVVLLDFGLSRSLTTSSREHAFAGTPRYMAPEQARGEPLTAAADWYSFGVVLHEALTGRLPPAVVGDALALPPELGPLSLALLRPEPSERPGAAEVLRALRVRRPEPAPYSRPPPSAPTLVGRRSELSLLSEAYASMLAGRSRVVLVAGESGIGKTALISHFVGEAESRGAIVLTGRCRERESVSYKALDGLMDDLVRYLDASTAEDAQRLLPEGVLDLTRLFPALRGAAAVAHHPRRAPEVPDQSTVKQSAIAAFRDLIAALRARAPLVLWIDDLQWSDTHSAELLGPLLDTDDPVPLLLVGSFRPSGARRGATLDALFSAGAPAPLQPTLVELLPLPASDAEALAAQLLRSAEPGTSAMARNIAREAAGHPLFIAELVHSRIGLDPSHPRPVQTLSELVEARVRALPSEARGLLEATAVAGTPLSQTVARRTRSLAPDQTARALDVLRASRLTRSHDVVQEQVLDVHHDRVREIIVQGLSPEARQEHHRNLAHAFEAERGTSPEVLATHFEAAGDLAQAGRYWIEAGHAAFGALAFGHAAELYEKAAALAQLDDVSRNALLVRRAQAFAYAGQATRAADTYLEAASALRPEEATELRRRAAEQLLLAGHLERGLAVIDTVLRALRMRRTRGGRSALPSIALGRLLVRWRGLRFRARREADIPERELVRVDASWSIACSLGVVDFLRGADFQNDHLLLALKAGEPRRLLRALTLEISYAATPGHGSPLRARRIMHMAEQLAAQLNDPAAAGLVVVSRGVAEYLGGNFEDAASACEQALASLSRCSGTVWETVTCQRFIIASLFHLGRFHRLTELVPPLIADSSARGNLYASTYFRASYSTMAWLAVDKVDAAREHLAGARADWTAAGVQLPHAWMLTGRMLLALYSGDGRDLWPAVEDAWPRFERAQFLRIAVLRVQLWQLRAMSALHEAQACLARGQRSRARALYQDARRSAARLGRERLSLAGPLALLLSSATAYGLGDREPALRSLRQSLATFEKQQMRAYAGATAARLGELLRGDEGAALVARGRAAIAAEGVTHPERVIDVLAPRFAVLV